MTSWEDRAHKAREERDASLLKVDPPLGWPNTDLPVNSQNRPRQLLTEREYTLTSDLTAVALLNAMREKKLKVEEVTRAFLRRAAIAQHATNCLTDLLWDEAIERAKYLDSLEEPLGPLHGLPISLKEHQGLKLYDKSCNVGYVSMIGTPSLDSPIQNILWKAGCVFYARTNQPQALQSLETNNNIYGRTVNPYNRNLTCGGSSGGEGALLGLRGSLLGLGGDIGGSVRVPAASNGLYGFKPTANRLGFQGMKVNMAGHEGIPAVYGPITTDRETINLFMKVFTDAQPWKIDAALDPKPWGPIEKIKDLKIAVMWSDGVVQPHPPVTRALNGVVKKCKEAGIKIVDWQPLDHAAAWSLYISLLYPDGGREAVRPAEEIGEPVMPLTRWLAQLPEVKVRSIPEYWQLVVQREIYRTQHAAHWNATAEDDGQEVDVILCPVGPGVASLHETSKYWPYTSHWNLLDYPAAVFPTGYSVTREDVRDESYQPMNEQDARNHGLYDPAKFEDAPIGLQVVGRRGMDEKVMAAVEAIENAMGRS